MIDLVGYLKLEENEYSGHLCKADDLGTPSHISAVVHFNSEYVICDEAGILSTYKPSIAHVKFPIKQNTRECSFVSKYCICFASSTKSKLFRPDFNTTFE